VFSVDARRLWRTRVLSCRVKNAGHGWIADRQMSRFSRPLRHTSPYWFDFNKIGRKSTGVVDADLMRRSADVRYATRLR